MSAFLKIPNCAVGKTVGDNLDWEQDSGCTSSSSAGSAFSYTYWTAQGNPLISDKIIANVPLLRFVLICFGFAEVCFVEFSHLVTRMFEQKICLESHLPFLVFSGKRLSWIAKFLDLIGVTIKTLVQKGFHIYRQILLHTHD